MKYLKFLITIAFAGCANPVVPTGGAKDLSPPTYTHVNIEHNQDYTYVRFQLSEQATVNEANKRIILSPANSNTIETSTGQNSVTIKISHKEPLKPNSYLQLRKGWLQDLNEKNPIDSTPFILLNTFIKITDSSVFDGSFTCLNGCKETSLKLYLFDSLNKERNLEGMYFTILDKNGLFQFPSFTKSSETKYLLLNDINANNTIDTNEYFNIYEFPLTDSINQAITYCPEIRAINPKFDFFNNTIRISGLKGALLDHPRFYSYHADTGYLLIQDSFIPKIIYDDDLKAYPVNITRTSFHTTARGHQYSDTDSTLTILINQTGLRKIKKYLTININDTTTITSAYALEHPNKLIVRGISPKKIKITIPDSSFLDTNNSLNNAISVDIDPSKLNFGTINIVKPNTDSNQYIIYLKQKDTYTKYVLNPKDNFTNISKLSGTYDLIIVRDQDLNLTYTKADVHTLTSEEAVGIIKNIVIKDKMENTINIDKLRLFTPMNR